MITDVQGCSTCPSGEERFEKYTTKIGGQKVSLYQYDYRHINGKLYSTIGRTVEHCRDKRDEWLRKEGLL